MRFNLRGWSMFGAGLVLGSLATGVLFAPPDLANQPPPWDNPAWLASAASVLGAGRARPQVAAAVLPASAAASAPAPQPVAAASQPLGAASQPVAAASQPGAASGAVAAASQPVVTAAAAVAAASQPSATATQPLASAQPAAAAQAPFSFAAASAPPKPETVAKTDAMPKPEHKRKRPARHIDKEDDAPSPAPDTAGASSDTGSGVASRSDERASQQRRNGDAATQEMGNSGVVVDTLHLPAETPLRASDSSSGTAGGSDASQ